MNGRMLLLVTATGNAGVNPTSKKTLPIPLLGRKQDRSGPFRLRDWERELREKENSRTSTTART